jgi:hypothetical protein
MNQVNIKELKHILYNNKTWNIKIYTHENNIKTLENSLSLQLDDGTIATAKSIPVIEDNNLPVSKTRWVMPTEKNKFYKYTSEDESWARPLGYGHEVTDLVFYVFQKPKHYGHQPKRRT